MASLRQPSLVFFLLTITFFVISPVFCKSEEIETLIDRICREPQVEDYEFCKNTFKDRIATDIYGLTKITIQQTYSVATYVSVHILELLNQTTDPSTKQTLVPCKDGYELVIRQFRLADVLFEKREYQDAFNAESESKSALLQCKSKLNDIVEGNKETRTLIAMSLASLDILLHEKRLNPSYQ